MLNRIIDMFANLLETAGLARLDPSLSTVVSILAIATALIEGIKWVCRWLRWITRQRPVNRLCRALKDRSVATYSEVEYQIRSYVPPRFVMQDNKHMQNKNPYIHYEYRDFYWRGRRDLNPRTLFRRLLP